MLNKVSSFYNANKYAIWWSVIYFAATWAIMKYMFNFDIFSRVRWWQLMHVHLHGFPGLVFGILILAAVPMYLATTVVIVRTKSPLFNIKFPKISAFIKNAFVQTPMEEENTSNANDSQDAVDEPAPEEKESEIPDTVPNEMRIAYMRAREHVSRAPVSAFDLGNVTKSATQTVPETQPEPITENATNEIPIPTDFDIEDTDSIIDTIPQFTDISFDDEDEDDTEIDTTDISELSNTLKPVAEYMESQSVPYKTINDVIITDKHAVVAHTDSDFWVADAETWFAAGKTRKSPIELVKRIAADYGVQPVLYLGATNIMDLEILIPQWEQDGIQIITDLKDLK